MSEGAEAAHILVRFSPLIVLAALAASAILIKLLRPVLRRYALAMPNARSSHRKPTPQGGGFAVLTAVIAVAGLGAVVLPQLGGSASGQLPAVLTAAALIALVGAVDDIRGVPIVPRLFLQALAVGLVVAGLPQDMRIVAALPWEIERVFLVIAGVWFVNVVNFMDGIDWITVAEVVPIAVGLVLIGAFGALPPTGMLVALAILGGILGFAPFNRPVATLFLGDVGSLPIGLLLGWLLVLLAGTGHLAAALLLPLYYLADATITLLRRVVAGERIWQAHRSHFYQRAMTGGFSVIEIVATIFAVNLVLVALALTTVLAAAPVVDFCALVVGGCLVGWLLVHLAHGKV